MNLGLVTRAQEPFNVSLSIFQELGDQERIVMTLNYLGHMSYRLGNILDALRYCQAGLELARANHLRQREADCLHSLGDTCVHTSQISEAIEYYIQALDCYQQVNDPQGLSDTLVDLGMCTSIQGHYEAALDYLTRALPVKQKSGDRPGEAVTRMKLGHVTQKQNRLELALQHYEQGLSIVRETGDRRTEGELFVGLSTLASRQGDWATGMSRIRQGLEIFQSIGDRVAYADGLESLARMSLEQGDFSSAQAQFEETLAISNETGYQWGTCAALLGLGERSFYCGDPQTARIYARQALQQALEMQLRPLQARIRLLLGHTLSGPEEQSEAFESYQLALNLYRALDRPQNVCEALAGLAELARAQGDLMRANTLVAEILTLLATTRLDGSDDPLQIYLTCYRVLCASQDPRAADLLQAGYNLLQARSAGTGSPEIKRMYLENFPAHRELAAEWEKHRQLAAG
jgi:tetratricopeptide (TPR) repeat protein